MTPALCSRLHAGTRCWPGSGAAVRDFSISRAAVSWGIPVPRDPAQTVYVWFDALLGYMSGE